MKREAKDEKCCECGAQAECFWPCIDPDIKSHSYCRPCVEQQQIKVWLELEKMKEERK